ncbi:MAG: pyridoxine 5'-phosphate synthase [Deltaproteobacteria bacterium]|nr:pyridoxine 5'-phosphate synthase [Deltaproteobacteria bacterium]
MARLGVNIDHIATLRQVRGTRYPDPAGASLIVEQAGADQITVHLREDRRHIQDRDLRTLRHTVQTELNLESAVLEAMVVLAVDVRPNTVTFVPERRKELTTEGGLDVYGNRKQLKEKTEQLKKAGIRVSFFIDPEERQIRESREIGADTIEIHTGRYADATTPDEVKKEFERIRQSALLGKQLGLYVAAGHGLHYQNTGPLAAIPEIQEFNIGHAIIARALFVGLEQAVREIVAIVKK